jgi:hypothetical protein
MLAANRKMNDLDCGSILNGRCLAFTFRIQPATPTPPSRDACTLEQCRPLIPDLLTISFPYLKTFQINREWTPIDANKKPNRR